jgi:hypothetical protein
MKFSGASGLSRIALNPECAWQTVMLRSSKSEPEFYEQVTGEVFPKEYGERLSARRRGSKFERNAFDHQAAKLRAVMAERLGVAAEDIWVRNLEDDEPGGHESNRIRRSNLTRAILSDRLEGKRTPEILIQPQLTLTVHGLARSERLFIAPDVLYLDSGSGRYRPADLKSFVVRDNQVAPGDLERSRLQLAIQSLALHEVLSVLADTRPQEHIGALVFATPYGLAPHAPQEESLDAPVHLVRRAIAAIGHHHALIEGLKSKDGVKRESLLLQELPNHYQDRCVSACALAGECKKRQQNRAAVLGDAAVEVLGPNMDVGRAAQLLAGATPRDQREREIAALLQELAQPFETLRRAA